MVCRADGVPAPTITWIKTGSSKILGTGEQFVITDTSGNDDGTYRCTAKNELGDDSKDVTLNVRSKFMCTLDVSTIHVCR